MSPKSFKHNNFTRAIFSPIKTIVKKIAPIFYVKLEYRYITGNHLNLSNPEKFSEKLQVLRLYKYPKNKLVKQCASRMGAREYLLSLGYNQYSPKLYGTYDNFDEINFSKLPNSFVMKCNHGSGFLHICYDKNTFNYSKARKDFKKWLKTDYGKKTVEPHYSDTKRFIIVEELLLENTKLPIEYKIHCFNGVAKSLYIVTDRENNIHYNHYYINWNPFKKSQFNNWTEAKEEIKRPENFDEMVRLAEALSKPFDFVRVDLYSIQGKIYFSELTFTPAKGTLKFADQQADYEMGEWLTITK